MPRMLDALNQTSPAGRGALLLPPVAPAAQVPPPAPAAHLTALAQDDADDRPYIEVGPKRSVEASPGVLDTPRPTLPFPPPHASQTRPPRPASPATPFPAPAGTPPSPTVAYRPVSGSSAVPRRSRLAPELVAFHAAGQPAGLAYLDLWRTIRSGGAAARASTLFFSSARSEAGTTTVVLNLAIAAARAGARVLVVDANLRRPALSARLGLAEVPGLREVLAGLAGLEGAVQATEVDGLTALTSGPIPGPDRLSVAAEVIPQLLANAAKAYDVVLVDGARWDGRADVTLFGAGCDVVFLVLPPAEADTPAVQALMQLIPEQGGRLAGTVLAGR